MGRVDTAWAVTFVIASSTSSVGWRVTATRLDARCTSLAMAHVERRRRNGRSVWRARYRAPDGRERSRSFARRADAERFLTGVESSKLRGEWVDPALGRTRLADWLDTWLETVRPTLKPKTVLGYRSLIRSRIVPALGHARLAGLQPSDVQTWIAAMQDAGLSASRIRQAHVVLAEALGAAMRDGLVSRNVARGAKLPRLERREARYFEPETVDQIAAALPEPDALAVRTLGTVGLRFGELAALRRRHVDLLRRRLRIEEAAVEVGGVLTFGTPKNHAARAVPLPAWLARSFEQHLDARVPVDPDALVFAGPRGGALRYSRFYSHVWRPTLAQLGLPPAGVHSLRHSAAAAMVAAGASLKALQTVLGHGSATFSLTVYGHLFDDDLDALAGRLDGLRRAPDNDAQLPRPIRGPIAADGHGASRD
jgi:integrase